MRHNCASTRPLSARTSVSHRVVAHLSAATPAPPTGQPSCAHPRVGNQPTTAQAAAASGGSAEPQHADIAQRRQEADRLLLLADRVQRKGIKAAKDAAAVARGQRMLRLISTVFYLRSQHRRADDDDGDQLRKVAKLFDGSGETDKHKAEQLLKELDKRATGFSLASLPAPRVVVLRHSVQTFLNRRLARLHAMQTRQAILLWRSTDVLVTGAPVPGDIANKLDNLPFTQTGSIPTLGMFFPGMFYSFVDSNQPHLHRITNNTAVAVSILLHPMEPDVPPNLRAGDTHTLSYMPLGIIVRPEGPPVRRVHDDVPDGCMLVRPQSASFTPDNQTLAHQLQAVVQEGGADAAAEAGPSTGARRSKRHREGSAGPMPAPAAPKNRALVRRLGYKLADGYAVTDYAAQGQTFRNATWLAHLAPPHDGHLTRASVYVVLTRFSTWKDVRLIAPLLPDSGVATKHNIMTTLLNLTAREPDLAAELERLQTLAAATERTLPQRLQELKGAIAAHGAPLY